jgi:pyruvate formate-lyase activating enzyme-like uncharacterized protein
MTKAIYSDKKYENLISNIEKLGKTDHIEILRIIKKHDNNTKITENNNGCFINLNELEPSTIEKIENLLNYIEDNKKELNKHESLKSNLKDNYLS